VPPGRVTAAVCVTSAWWSRGGKARQAGTTHHPGGCGYVKGPCRTLLVSRRRFRDGSRGRSPDSRIILLANAFPAVCRPVASLLAFVPAYSGASVRELHPLPKSIISRANIATSAENYHLLPPMSSLILPHQNQWIHGAVRETIVPGNATGVVGRHGSHQSSDRAGVPRIRYGGRLWADPTAGGLHPAPDGDSPGAASAGRLAPEGGANRTWVGIIPTMVRRAGTAPVSLAVERRKTSAATRSRV